MRLIEDFVAPDWLYLEGGDNFFRKQAWYSKYT